MIIAKIGQKN